MPKNYKKKNKETKKKQKKDKKKTLQLESHMTADHQGNNSLTSRIEMRQSLWWKRTNMQLHWCILLYKKTLIQLTLSPDED